VALIGSGLTAGVDWAEVDPRTRWRNRNLARTVLACTGFAVNVAAIAAFL
jgi:hypothetical protein